MKKKKTIISKGIAIVSALSLCLGSLFIPQKVSAENPIIQTTYTADPSPLVVGDTLYVYTTRDELKEQKYNDWSYMNEWRCYSTKDMVNWTDHGQIAHAQTFDKESKSKENWRAWAQHVVEMPIKEDGKWVKKYFLFAPFNGTKIDVAVADRPEGPFQDATPGKYLIDGGWDGGNIDPTVYIEDHGNPEDYENYDVYLYWGNPYLRYCKLTNDLLDVDPDTNGDGVLSEEEKNIDPRFPKSDNKILGEVRPGLHSEQMFGEESYKSFGEPSQGKETTGKFPTQKKGEEEKRCAFEEGPWLIKHDDGNPDTDDYFMFFVGGRIPGETVEYSTAPTPTGPWTYRALLMGRENGYSCIHPGVVEFKGKNYLFYLNEMLVGGDGSNRSVCVKEFEYDENNLIKKETPDNVAAYMVQGMTNKTKGSSYFSVDPIGTLNPYELNQAETICWESNLDGPKGGFNGTGRGVKTKSKTPCTEIDAVTGKTAFWKSAALGGVAVYDIDNNDFIRVREVDFGSEGAKSFTISAACGLGTPLENPVKDSKGNVIANPDDDTAGGTIEIWLDYTDTEKQKLVGTVEIGHTGGTNEYDDFRTNLKETVMGIHDVQFIFKGEAGRKLFNLDTWMFMKEETTPTLPLPVPTPRPTATPTSTATPTPTLVPPATPTPTPADQGKDTPVVTSPQPTPDVSVNKPVKVAKVKGVKVKVTKAKKAKISWKKVSGAAGYEVVYSTDKKLKKAVKKITAKKTKCVTRKLKKGKKYYVKVRAFKKAKNGRKVRGRYSAMKKITVR